MVLVFRIGRLPVTYSASPVSIACLATICLYLAVLIFPYLLCGWSFNFFSPLERSSDRPKVSAYPNFSFTLGNGTHSLHFDVTPVNELPADVRVPIILWPRHQSDQFLELSAYFPLAADETVTKVRLTIPFEANFTETGRSFKSIIDIHPSSYIPACRVDVLGSLSFVQEKELNVHRYTAVPLTTEFLDYTRAHPIQLNESHPSVAGDPLFVTRNEIWTFGTCILFEIGFRMRIPVVHFVKARAGIYSFLDGWTAYVAIATPLLIVVWRVLAAMFRSGFVPAHAFAEAEINQEKIPKFNR
jgi:hypothetical protein